MKQKPHTTEELIRILRQADSILEAFVRVYKTWIKWPYISHRFGSHALVDGNLQ